jgi:hypothetical protein
MVNLADLDTVFLVPCKHCAQLMQETERFCPFCGKDQSASAQEPVGHALPKKASNDEVDFDLGLVHPSDYWQKEILEAGESKRWAGDYRLVIGIVAGLMALLVFALVHDDFYLGRQREETKLKAFRANVEQVQRALSRGDLSAAERVLDVLEADYAEAPSVQELREAFDRRVQEQAARQAQPREADVKAASKAAEPEKTATRSVQAPLAPDASQTGVADPKESGCNEALRAMALCPTR